MAEMSYFWDNPGTGDSPAAPGYGDDTLMDVAFRMLLNGTGNRGVVRGWQDELLVEDGGGLQVYVNTGASINYGLFYHNTTRTSLTIDDDSTRYVVIRRSWAAQTSRMAQVAAITQTVDVTYDIPLATVITAAGDISSITDTREWVEYSTDLIDDVVEEGHIGEDQVTTAKLENHRRYVVRSAGMFHLDGTNPAAWYSNTTVLPYRRQLRFTNVATASVWTTFRVPADFTGTDLDIYLWNSPSANGGSGDVLWGWDAWVAAADGAAASQNGTQLVANDDRLVTQIYRDEITTLTVSAGDIVHMEIYRDGADGSDDCNTQTILFAMEASYTADS